MCRLMDREKQKQRKVKQSTGSIARCRYFFYTYVYMYVAGNYDEGAIVGLKVGVAVRHASPLMAKTTGFPICVGL